MSLEPWIFCKLHLSAKSHIQETASRRWHLFLTHKMRQAFTDKPTAWYTHDSLLCITIYWHSTFKVFLVIETDAFQHFSKTKLSSLMSVNGRSVFCDPVYLGYILKLSC